ncbi:hypothetical protein WNZ14_12340 [Hoeflea sp. AS60]|uniref:hypothetical protein n=1 Tax=Hoeflea sp. AS60 TaxID=3135780 RepID=UPI0031744CED
MMIFLMGYVVQGRKTTRSWLMGNYSARPSNPKVQMDKNMKNDRHGFVSMATDMRRRELLSSPDVEMPVERILLPEKVWEERT